MMRTGSGLGLILLAVSLPAADAPAFEAASVKASQPGTRAYMRGGPGTSDPGQFWYSGASLRSLLMTAYSAKAYQISGPDWMGIDKFDIVAKVPAGSTKQQLNVMLQNLLAERFGVAVHRESRELLGYELRIAKEGLKLKPAGEPVSKDDKAHEGALLQSGRDVMPPSHSEGLLLFWDRSLGYGNYRLPNNRGRTLGIAQSMAALVSLCEARAGLPVVDKTGLTGRYDYSFDYVADSPARQPDASPTATAMEPGEDFLTAFQRQLGLKLEKKRVPIDVLVIERANRAPVEN
jgi:uncharacterized protein (TIGR03435 family)